MVRVFDSLPSNSLPLLDLILSIRAWTPSPLSDRPCFSRGSSRIRVCVRFDTLQASQSGVACPAESVDAAGTDSSLSGQAGVWGDVWLLSSSS